MAQTYQSSNAAGGCLRPHGRKGNLAPSSINEALANQISASEWKKKWQEGIYAHIGCRIWPAEMKVEFVVAVIVQGTKRRNTK
jgi:hypothetical protein